MDKHPATPVTNPAMTSHNTFGRRFSPFHSSSLPFGFSRMKWARF
jgi:hypothetical protein